MNLNEMLIPSPVPPLDAASVTPGGSPHTYTATQRGTMYVSGGTVSLMQLTRNGTTYGLGLLAGAFHMSPGDQLMATYLVAPTMLWVPA